MVDANDQKMGASVTDTHGKSLHNEPPLFIQDDHIIHNSNSSQQLTREANFLKGAKVGAQSN